MEKDLIASLIHLYQDGAFNRREIVKRLTECTGSVAAALAVIESAGLANAQTGTCPAGVQVAEGDPAIRAQMLTIHGEGGPLYAYQALPADLGSQPRPAVLVIHENRGLNDHIKDVTRRVAKAGFVAIGIDLLSRQGGTHQFTDPMQQTAAYGRTLPEQRREDMMSALLTIRDQSYVRRDRLGTVGFCAGGGNVFDLAVNTDILTAAVVFYGAAPTPPELINNMSARLLGFFAELDRNINMRLPGLLTSLMNANKRHEIHIYENVGHAFHNDTGAAYNAAAACDAWAKTIDFFNRHLNAA
jgi:carboxymethylenebutenolidase